MFSTLQSWLHPHQRSQKFTDFIQKDRFYPLTYPPFIQFFSFSSAYIPFLLFPFPKQTYSIFASLSIAFSSSFLSFQSFIVLFTLFCASFSLTRARMEDSVKNIHTAALQKKMMFQGFHQFRLIGQSQDLNNIFVNFALSLQHKTF